MKKPLHPGLALNRHSLWKQRNPGLKRKAGEGPRGQGKSNESNLPAALVLLFACGVHTTHKINSRAMLREDILSIAHAYVLHVRKWAPDTYTLRIKGRWEGNIYAVSGEKSEDAAKARELSKNSTGRLNFCRPPALFIFVDMNKRKVVKDPRPDETEKRPSP